MNMIMIKLPIMWSIFYLGASDFAWQYIFLIAQDDENNNDDKNNDNDDDADNNNDYDDNHDDDDDEPDAEDQNYLKIANFQPSISRFFMIVELRNNYQILQQDDDDDTAAIYDDNDDDEHDYDQITHNVVDFLSRSFRFCMVVDLSYTSG